MLESSAEIFRRDGGGMKFLSWLFVVMLAFASAEADAARRLGGGGSIGKQSSNVTQRSATPAPTSPQNAGAPAVTPPPATAPVAPRRPWGAMLGGLAAGLGLAWLAHSLGFGEAFGQFMLIALVVFIAMMAIGWFMRSRRGSPPAGYALQGAGGPAESAVAPRQYSPDKVGNDASARPWERSSMAFDVARYPQGGGGVQIGSALTGSQNWGIPPGFDTEGFIAAAKRNFVTLQDAWDKSDFGTLRSMMTDEMLGEIRSQLADRESHGSGEPNRTEVVMIEAQLLGIEDLGGDYMASVEFSGMIREEPSAGPSPFREVWNMTKPKSGTSGWLVAGVQALQ
jgi:predicted lipid-binding transport protein (Tim44 family)